MKIEEIEASKVTVRLKTTNGVEFFMVAKNDHSGIEFYAIDDHLVGLNTKSKPVSISANELYEIIEGRIPDGGQKAFGERSVNQRRKAPKSGKS